MSNIPSGYERVSELPNTVYLSAQLWAANSAMGITSDYALAENTAQEATIKLFEQVRLGKVFVNDDELIVYSHKSLTKWLISTLKKVLGGSLGIDFREIAQKISSDLATQTDSSQIPDTLATSLRNFKNGEVLAETVIENIVDKVSAEHVFYENNEIFIALLYPLEPWVRQVAKNKTRDHQRKTSRRSEPLGKLEPWTAQPGDNCAKDNPEQFLNLGRIFVPIENSIDMDMDRVIEETSKYLDECIELVYQVFLHKSYRLNINFHTDIRDKARVIAAYCRLAFESNYCGKRDKISKKALCRTLGFDATDSSLSEHKKRYERQVIDCVSKKIKQNYNESQWDDIQETLS